MSTKHASLTRRNFLLTLSALSAGGAATAAAIAAKISTSPVLPARGKRATRGYHATAHVSHYYRTAKV